MNNSAFDFQALPAAMRALPQWLGWKWDRTDPEKPTKVPFYVCGKRRWGAQGSPADRANLATFEKVAQELSKSCLKNRQNLLNNCAFDGIGFALLPGDDLICLDLDQHFDPVLNKASKVAQELINLTQSYTEKSVSGTGLHIICAGIAQKIGKNSSGLEVFSQSQFIICTGWRLPDTPQQIKPLGARALEWIQAKVDSAKGFMNGAARPGVHLNGFEPGKRDKVESALLWLDPNEEYDRWWKIAAAVQCELGDSGFAVWDYWSSKGKKYPGKRTMLEKWKSFDPDKGITGGTLYKWAKERGWVPPKGGGRPNLETKHESAAPGGDDAGKSTEFADSSENRSTNSGDEESPATDVPELTRTKSGSIINNTSNALILLEELLQRKNTTAQHCVFSDRDLLTVTGKVSEITEVDVLKLAVQIQRIPGAAAIGHESVRAALQTVLAQNTVDPVRDWLDSLTWDGTARLDRWLPTSAGAPDTDFVRTVGANTLIGCVARQYQPGVKMDNMLVLEGNQGLGKSPLLSALFSSEWFGDGLPQFSDSGFGRLLRGKLCFEIAEMSSMTRTDIEHTKKTIAIQIDRYRDPYARREAEHPRRCIFIGTTNEAEYLIDQTGNRRFWPVKCGIVVDLAWIAENREQLFAEAVVRYRAGESWHLVPIDEAHAEQESRRVCDPWEAPITEWIDWHSTMAHINIEGILSDVIKLPIERHTTREMKRVANILRTLQWVRPATRSSRDGKRTRWWTHPKRSD